jgi:hypothetical protein
VLKHSPLVAQDDNKKKRALLSFKTVQATRDGRSSSAIAEDVISHACLDVGATDCRLISQNTKGETHVKHQAKDSRVRRAGERLP